ncbi:MAG: glycerol-3-phosphate dehydrogenase/oxidase [Gemmatimonadetes bacterium]|nr:glycerol-3-phosphate dehydrogenase/oxidase [Gemmatimonadota bacterium]
MSAPRPFDAAARALHWRALGEGEWDLLVIGGGVTGAGIARDAAARGLRVALVEAGDWGQGTSSRSSRLIHGGLRYLQNRDLSLVFEASSERRRLLALAPHLVHPLRFLFPVFEWGVGFRTLQAGMWLYDALSLFRNIGRHQMLDAQEIARQEPGLRQQDLRGGALYYDAWVDDARLTLATAVDAHRRGAATVSYAPVTEFLRDVTGVRGARVRDVLSGAEVEVRAALIINATGPWCDVLRRMADPAVAPRLRPTKGVHIVLRRERLDNQHAITFESPLDGRVMFVLPWGRFSYVGTTDTDYDGSPRDAVADREDVEYLLASANAIFPRARLETGDVVSSWAGLRPLLVPDAEDPVSEGRTSREHAIWRDPAGLLNVAGGKLTTFRVMAAEAVDAAAKILREERSLTVPASPTEGLPLPGAPDEPWDHFRERMLARARGVGLSQEQADHLLRAYGTATVDLLGAVQENPTMGEPIVAELPYIRAELAHVVQREMTLTLEDALQRRLHLLYEAEDGGMSVARGVAELLAREPNLGWDDAEIQRQLAAYRATVAEALSFRPPA